MIYFYLGDDFTAITEPAGIIQNLSPFTIEVSTTGEPDSGVPVPPHQLYFFSNAPVYARSPEGTAKVRVVAASYGSCCCSNNNLCSSCCDDSGDDSGGSSSGDDSDCIKRILIDGVEQDVSGNTAILDLSRYLKGHETVSRSEVRALFI